MSQFSQSPQSSQTPQPMTALFDPKSVKAREYPGMLLGFLTIWCFIGIVLMFFGSDFGAAALLDTIGLLLIVAETLFILSQDREGFYTGAGFFKVADWSQGQRVALAIAEVVGFALVLILYLVRVVMKQYAELQEPAPLTPPAKRKRPQRR